MREMPILFNNHMWCDNGHEISPSSKKPKFFTDYVLSLGLPCKVVNPCISLSKDDFYRAHDRKFVDDIFKCELENGFGTKSPEVNKTLPWTSSSMFFACRFATPEVPAISPTSGFHHSGYDFSMGFCTFNGLMIAALKCLTEYPKQYKKIAIIDCDAHDGNGTTDIINKLRLHDCIYHNTFGAKFHHRYKQAPYTTHEGEKYLKEFDKVRTDLIAFAPDLIIYQAGADVHIDDIYGGVLTTDRMIRRDISMFLIAKELKIPLAFNLAGGYQVDENGSIQIILDLHANTVLAAKDIYSL